MYKEHTSSIEPFDLNELKRSRFSFMVSLLFFMPISNTIKKKLLGKVIDLEGGIMRSYTIRKILYENNEITLGSYSYGNFHELFKLPVKTIIGRYTSIGPGVTMFQANHPVNFVSMHPFFFRNDIGIVKEESIKRKILKIGNDVWFGANSIVCPGCQKVGNGVVIGAGAVVTKDVPHYAIVAGNPAKTIKMRFKDITIEKLLKSRWWELEFGQLKKCRDKMTQPLNERRIDEFLDKIALLKNEKN
jgi:virginiamycin A acetyltransferase